MTRVLAGPYCTQILGDLGAEVIKIEHPVRGDDTRAWGPPYAKHIKGDHTDGPGESAYFLSVNRNKKSLGLSFAHPSGVEILHKLAKDCDVLVENYLPGALKKYGMDYESVSKVNPALIYASITGYGQTGPYSSRAGYDVMVEAEMGLMHITGSRDGPPVKVGVAVTDLTTGLYTSNSIMAALLGRARTGKGQHVDVALSDCQVATLANMASSCLISGKPDSGRWGTAHPSIVPYKGFKTADGDILLGGGNDRLFGIMCEKFGKPEWAKDERFFTNNVRVKNRNVLEDIIESETKKKTTKEWLDVFEGSGLPYAAINDIQSTLSHEHVLARDMVKEVEHPTCGPIKLVNTPVKYSFSTPSIRTPPPTLGQHTDEILTEVLGMSDADVKSLRSEGVVAYRKRRRILAVFDYDDFLVAKQSSLPDSGPPVQYIPYHSPQLDSSTASSILPALPSQASTTPQIHSNNAQSEALQPPALDQALLSPKQSPPKLPNPNGNSFAVPQFSASTEEILKRVNANATANAGTQGWEAAREQVLKSMRTSNSMPTPPPIPSTSKRGRGGSKLASPAAPAPAAVAAATAAVEADPAVTANMTPAPAIARTTGSVRGRGSGRGRGRGGGRGGKRKRAESADSDNDSDISSSYTPLPTKTKSGRNVTKPTTFTPPLPSPSSAPKKRRPYNKRNIEATVCKTCQRGHSPASNMIVFCDGCNTPYHQFCHHPPIEKEVVTVAEKEWFCGACTLSRESANLDVTDLVSGEGLSVERKRAYLSNLSRPTLVSLLLHATTLDPKLPVFTPKARSLVSAASEFNPSNAPLIPTPLVTQSSTSATAPHISALNSHSLPVTRSPLTAAQRSTAAPTSSTSDPPATPATSALIQQPPRSPTPPPAAEDPEPYDGYDTDPPAHYPKPGHGLARQMRPESEDLQWLVDDNFEVFSHIYQVDAQQANQGLLGNGSAGLERNGGEDGSGGMDVDGPHV
ncbi:hypothetical protein B0A49_03420 [Cryomyces minteri]|uniref:PHD-type domain-containing protein n=1 Tax=Cryomyces minteri TaxID=331657 RepID=A0A4U0XB00_9PEZI|nr:hypothetical protein B0A49_03420 [Cryomyces minteri]